MVWVPLWGVGRALDLRLGGMESFAFEKRNLSKLSGLSHKRRQTIDTIDHTPPFKEALQEKEKRLAGANGVNGGTPLVLKLVCRERRF